LNYEVPKQPVHPEPIEDPNRIICPHCLDVLDHKKSLEYIDMLRLVTKELESVTEDKTLLACNGTVIVCKKCGHSFGFIIQKNNNIKNYPVVFK